MDVVVADHHVAAEMNAVGAVRPVAVVIDLIVFDDPARGVDRIDSAADVGWRIVGDAETTNRDVIHVAACECARRGAFTIEHRPGLADKCHSRFRLNALASMHAGLDDERDRKSTRLNSSHSQISYAVFCLKKKKKKNKKISNTRKKHGWRERGW